MSENETRESDGTVAAQVASFYEHHPYPPPKDDLTAYAGAWNEPRRRAESHLFWPSQPYRDDRSILVAGCGTVQAAHYAVRWPRAKITGIDVSAESVAFTQGLQKKHGLENLDLYKLPVERACDLGRTFDYVVCTGVLHHLTDPDVGLRALRDVLAPNGAIHLMVYAPYGRAGVYMVQDYARRLRIGWTDSEVNDLIATLKALPADHPLVPLLRKSPDFASAAGVADALLHPQDRPYSVPQLLEFLDRGELRFGRWVRQASYLPFCGAIGAAPHASRLAALPPHEQYAAIELFRGTMVRHSVIAYRSDEPDVAIDFSGDGWLDYVPIRLPDTIAVKEKLPPGASAVLINRNHTFNDLYLPIDAARERLLDAIDGDRSIGRICGDRADRIFSREFFQQLWRWDQVVFDMSKAEQLRPTPDRSRGRGPKRP